MTGYSGASTYGTYGSGFYNATTTLNPTYGITGYSTGVSTSTVYGRAIRVSIADVAASTPQHVKLVYEATATSAGSCGQMNAVIDPILSAIFKKFPGDPSESRTERVDIDGKC